MKYFFLLFLMAILPSFYLKAQDPIGLPQVSSYTSLDYKGGTQNWGIAQDRNGILYFANNEGLLTYNGAYWKIYPTPNKTIIRSVKIDASGKIYIGGQDEIGYFLPNEYGILTYHSLKNLIPPKERQFADVWDIVFNGKEIYFRTVNKIICFNSNNKVDVYPTPIAWVYMGRVGSEIYAQEINIGIKIFKESKWEILCDDKRIKSGNVTAVLPYNGDTLLITTLNDGLFLLKGNELINKKTAEDKIFYNDRINGAIQINKDLYALGTTSSGLLIINRKGALVRQFSYTEGLYNSNIRNILLDQHQNLWMGLDDGISFIAFNSAIKHIYPDRKRQVSSYASRIFDNKLYVGTSNGVFSAPLNTKQEDLSNSQSQFSEVVNTKGQTWGLAEINKHLLLANEDGTSVIEGNNVKQLYKGLGTWLFSPIAKDNNNVIAGTYTGLQYISFKDNEFSNRGTIAALNEPLRFMAIDEKLNCIWASHPYRGIFKIDLSPDKQKMIKATLLTQKDGLPLTLYNYIFKIKNRIVAATADGIYEYDAAKKKFKPSQFFRPIFKSLSIQYLTEDPDGNIWFVTTKKVGVVDFKKNRNSNFTIVEFPELTSKIVAGFENIYPYDDRNIFIGANKGLIHIDYRKYAANIFKPNVLLGQIRIAGKTDSVFFGGYFTGDRKAKHKLSFEYNSLHFEYASTLFEQKENIEFSYKLEGYDDDWSAWSSKSEKDYTNLAHGKYVFLVKARNNLGNESKSISYEFAISPAWYRSNVAYVIYFLLFVYMLYLLIKVQEKDHKKQQDNLRQKHQLEIERNEQQITKLQKKQLEADVEFKNKELATTTMHLVQRGKLLSKIGDELLPLVQQTTSKDTANDLKKVIRLLNEAKKLDNDWEQFSIHFDHVHANFLSNLKEKYPNLSPSDLKLCAYLKLNLSSKEISQLLNITPRAVEVSRYRLRKKLNLKPEVNLFDFLLNTSPKHT